MQDVDRVPIENLNISKRIFRALKRSGIFTIGDLKRFYPSSNLLQIHLIGEKSLIEISKALKELHHNPIPDSPMELMSVQPPVNEEKNVVITNPLSIDVLGIPTAIKARLKKHGIKTIEDIRKTPDSTLLNINQIGKKTLTDIRQKIAQVTDNPEVYGAKTTPLVEQRISGKSARTVEKKTMTWAEIVEDYWRDEKEVYAYILLSRFGVAPKTLEEIAGELSITRERVRQIQEAVAIRYLKHVRWMGGATT